MKYGSLFLILTAAAPRAQDDFTLDWSSLSGGGQSFGGTGEYTVESTLGQFTADDTAGGPPGEFGLSSGYWTFTLNEPLDLGMAMLLSGATVTLTWDDTTGVPVQLESSGDLQLWMPVYPQPQHPPFLDVTGAQRRFYRLMPVP